MTKRKHLSKNKKKAWKHTDVNDVDEFLEDKRLEERTGTGSAILGEKSDTELFFIDKQTDKSEVDPVLETKRQRYRNKPLRCHALLEPDTRVKAIRGYGTKRKAREKKIKGLPPVDGVMTGSQKRSSMDRTKTQIRNLMKKKQMGKCYELWGDEDINAKPEDVHSRHWDLTRQRRVKPPRTYHKKPTVVPGLELPHAGTSYNPDLQSHQELLALALEVEIKKDRQEKKLKRALDDKFPSAKEAPTEASKLQEMSAGLGNETDSEEDESATQSRPLTAPVVRNKKTLKQRRKTWEQKQKVVQDRNTKKARIQKNDFNRLKSINKELKVREKEIRESVKSKRLKSQAKEQGTKKLGKHRFEASDIELKLNGELTGSLRELKPEGCLMLDRFKSLQKRSLIEGRKFGGKDKKKPVKKKRKVFEKNTVKEVTL